MTNSDASNVWWNVDLVGARSLREGLDYIADVKRLIFRDYIARSFDTECSIERGNLSKISDALEYADLQKMVNAALDNCGKEYAIGVEKVVLFYHPDMESQVVKALSLCILSPTNGLRLIGAYYDGKCMPLPIVQIPSPEMRHDLIGVITSNPDYPIFKEHDNRILQLESDYPKNLREILGIPSLSERLVRESVLPYFGDYEDCSFEPNGRSKFPDFRITLSDGEIWALEVTEVAPERNFLEADKPAETGAKRLKPYTSRTDAFKSELTRILGKKAQRASQLDGLKYCLGIYAPVDMDLALGPDVWKGQDLSAFDSVIVVQSDKSVAFVKGEPAAPSLF